MGTPGSEVTQLRWRRRVLGVPSSRKTETRARSEVGCTSSQPHERTLPSSAPSAQPRGHRPGQVKRAHGKTQQGQCIWKAGASPDSRGHAQGARAGYPAPLGSSSPRVLWTDPWGRPSHSQPESPSAPGGPASTSQLCRSLSHDLRRGLHLPEPQHAGLRGRGTASPSRAVPRTVGPGSARNARAHTRPSKQVISHKSWTVSGPQALPPWKEDNGTQHRVTVRTE